MSPLPPSMPGILVTENGGVEVLNYRTDLPVPQLKPGEVLVRNEYIGVNFIDTYFRTGLYKVPLPLIPGKEAAGTVVLSSTPDLAVGSRVAYMGDATYAELTAVPAQSAAKIPDGVSTESAAASLIQGLTALTFIRNLPLTPPPPFNKKSLPSRSSFCPASSSPPPATKFVLVHASSGGTGSLLTQILSQSPGGPYTIIGTASSPVKAQASLESGADHVIDTSTDSIVSRISEITSGKGVDVIFDGVGKDTFDLDLEVVAKNGTIVVFGSASGPVPPVDLFKLSSKNIKLMRPSMPGYLTTKEEMNGYTAELFELLRKGKVKSRVHRVYDLKDVAQAHLDLEGRKTVGKLLLRVRGTESSSTRGSTCYTK